VHQHRRQQVRAAGLHHAGAGAQAIDEGAVSLYESAPATGRCRLRGDRRHGLLPVFEAKDQLEAAGQRVRIVAVANPRRLYRPGDVAWQHSAEPDDRFMDDAPSPSCSTAMR
jgi:phosphoketolase